MIATSNSRSNSEISKNHGRIAKNLESIQQQQVRNDPKRIISKI